MLNVQPSPKPTWETLVEFNLPGQPGAPQLAEEYAAAAVDALNLSPTELERLKTLVADAVLNAIESNNRFQPDWPPFIQLRVSVRALADQKGAPIPGSGRPPLITRVTEPESARGWGFFLVERQVNDIQSTGEGGYHRIELFLYLE
jgi:hypothetical protein